METYQSEITPKEKNLVMDHRQNEFFDTTKKDKNGKTQFDGTIKMCERQYKCYHGIKIEGFSCDEVKLTDFCNTFMETYQSEITPDEKALITQNVKNNKNTTH